MKTKNILSIVILLISILFSNLTYAQPHRQGPPPMMPDSMQIIRIVTDLSQSLSLSTKQKTEIQKLYFAHFNNLRASAEKQRKQNRQEMEEKRLAFEKKVKQKLNKEQAKKFEDFQKHRQPPHRRPNNKKK